MRNLILLNKNVITPYVRFWINFVPIVHLVARMRKYSTVRQLQVIGSRSSRVHCEDGVSKWR